MDLKLNSITWVGRNISQKFETVCQQVDNIVSQDTVEFVENKLQTMGGSVKRFYSDVVHDLLPSLVDPVKYEAHEVVLKRSDATFTNNKFVINMEEESAITIIKPPHVEPNLVDATNDQLDHGIELHHENKLISPVFEDPVDATKSDLFAEKKVARGSGDKDVVKNTTTDRSSEILELMSEMNLCEPSLFSKSTDSNNKNARGIVVEISHANSVDVVECPRIQRVDKVCDNFEDDPVRVYDSSNSLTSSGMAVSVTSCEEGFLDSRLYSSNNTKSIEFDNLDEESLEYLPMKAVLCTDAIDSVGRDYDSWEAIPSSPSSPILSLKDNEAQVEIVNSSSIVSLRSKEEVSRTNYIMSPSTVETEALTISSDNGISHDYGDDLDYFGMKTIELCDNLKLEDSCIMVDNSALYAVSYRTRKLRSFKKRIQDAFAPKKSLTKEYEQLAIGLETLIAGRTNTHCRVACRHLQPPPWNQKSQAIHVILSGNSYN